MIGSIDNVSDFSSQDNFNVLKELFNQPVPVLNIPLYTVLIIMVILIFICLIVLLLAKKKTASKYNFDLAKDCIEALNESSEEIRVRACWSLQVHKSPDAEQSLFRLLLDESKFVRGAAASAIGALKNDNSLKALEEAKETEIDENTKSQIERAIKRIKGELIPVHDTAESLDDLEQVVVKLDTAYDKAPEKEKEKKEKKGFMGIFSKPKVTMLSSMDIMEEIRTVKDREESGTATIPLSEEKDREIKEIPPEKGVEKEKITLSEIKSGQTCEISIQICPETDTSLNLLKELQRLQEGGISFRVNLDFKWKEEDKSSD